MDQRADHRTHLMLQERARRGRDAHFIAVARDIEPVERLYRRFGLALGRAKGREVVLADQPLRRRVHGCAVERPRHAPGAVLLQRQIGAPIDDAIEIMALDGREARIEIRRDLFGREHRDRLRAQVKIDRIAHRVVIPIFGEIDMRDLAERMHAGVGAPGTGNNDALAGEGRDRVGEHALHRNAVVLRLPADKRRAVIFDGEFVAWHLDCHSTRVPGAIGVPRKNSSAGIGCRPARCNSRSLTAPSPHATVSWSSSTRPGVPSPSPLAVRKTLMRPAPASSNQAPGNGDSPRQWSWTSFQGLVQSIRVSLLSIFFA